jgi:hypothetical protein
MTSVRPGSMTVGYGYEKGADRGEGVPPLADDETFRWKDVTFFRVHDEGIGMKVNFRYLKNHRNPPTQKMVQGKKSPFNVPLQS